MAAKIATRNKSTKTDENAELFRVVAAGTDRPVYPGNGVSREQAEFLAADLVAEVEIKPAEEVARFA